MFQSGILAPTLGTLLIMLTIVIAHKDFFYDSWVSAVCLIVIIVLC